MSHGGVSGMLQAQGLCPLRDVRLGGPLEAADSAHSCSECVHDGAQDESVRQDRGWDSPQTWTIEAGVALGLHGGRTACRLLFRGGLAMEAPDRADPQPGHTLQDFALAVFMYCSLQGEEATRLGHVPTLRPCFTIYAF